MSHAAGTTSTGGVPVPSPSCPAGGPGALAGWMGSVRCHGGQRGGQVPARVLFPGRWSRDWLWGMPGLLIQLRLGGPG